MDNFKLYSIRCLTNLHVGNGDATYSIVDNQVQRDVITNFPVINPSSLKGSLKSFLKSKYDDTALKYIFGHEDHGIGNYKIFPGTLLSIPVRSNKKPFFRATCPRIIKDFIDFIDTFEYDVTYKDDLEKIKSFTNQNINSISVVKCFNEDIEDVKNLKIEGFKANLKDELIFNKKEDLENIFGKDLIVINDLTFSKIVEKLPVIARNKLNNGESENLWYEEVVPRETRFYFGVIQGNEYTEEFKGIEKNVVQIGGNATIGYGFCDINSIRG
ncbi:type III-B CRISPR module RAMP protein Cmr4 [Clostridium algidicarnis]|uniref:Type III-B CRISPR module RAMP protein Cmr4 n=1 Tax=Clostridium algidicarnis TaxID=37659 RepID=A0ABS6C2B7_9CLOT|nr:type III-B CRISPR module RAMP protein Cmr4 [Clostridium algidicarnis]MBU3219624.1 type III-B CRISPR module RAMP protein Cmr4 [Clostridium algidicarnis]